MAPKPFRSDVQMQSFDGWRYDFVIDGKHTLDPVKHAGPIGRTANRKRIFMEPMFASEYLKGKRVLDLGCSTGYWSLLSILEGGAAFVRGIDAGPNTIPLAELVFTKYNIPKSTYDFVFDDVYHRLEEEIETYDIILCLGLFYHIKEPFRLLQLINKCCSGIVIIDTVVHNMPEAIISVRPVCDKSNLRDGEKMGVELVSSPKAICWMAETAGFHNFRMLRDEYDKITAMWDYIRGERVSFALSKSEDLDRIFPNANDPKFLDLATDLKEYGYFPEMLKNERDPR